MKSNEDVAQVLWNWKESDSTEETTRRKRKKNSLVRFCIMFFIGLVLFFPLHHVWTGGILYILSLLMLVGGFAVPHIYLAFDRVERFLAITIGSLFTWVRMISFFYVCFVPGRILLCLFRKDPLQRARKPDAQSYWISKQRSSERTQYQRLLLMNILGISAYYHDSAAALLCDGEIVAAAQEERFTRKKHYAGFPVNAVRYCLAQGGLQNGKLDAAAFYEKPVTKFARILETYFGVDPKGLHSFVMALPIWAIKKLRIPMEIDADLLESIDSTGRQNLIAIKHLLCAIYCTTCSTELADPPCFAGGSPPVDNYLWSPLLLWSLVANVREATVNVREYSSGSSVLVQRFQE